MTEKQGLSDRIRGLLRDTETRRTTRQAWTESKMAEIEKRLKHVKFLQRDWMTRIVQPKLQEMAAMFPNAGAVAMSSECDCAMVTLSPTERVPIEARLCVSFTPDPAVQNLGVDVEIAILPAPPDVPRGGRLEQWLEAADTKALEEFLDDQIIEFVRAYVALSEPDSPAQAQNVEVDPVCGMKVPKVDAAAKVKVGGRVYYFCVQGCADKFRASPERYVKSVS